MDKTMVIADLVLLIALLFRNWECMIRIAEIEERIDAMERNMQTERSE